MRAESAMQRRLGWIVFLLVGIGIFLIAGPTRAQTKGQISQSTEVCLECHNSVTPGLVAQWRKSRHGSASPAEDLKKPKIERRVSNEKVPEKLLGTVVGCAECHTMNSGKHQDSFEHHGYKVHIIVTPSDCSTCHPVEVQQYGKNVMSQAYGNLMNNPLYRDLANTVNGTQSFAGLKTTLNPPGAETNSDSCLYCHGTEVKVTGLKVRNTSMGEMEFPVLSGWPNQGVGRMNPDDSKGTCTACHTHHEFSIEMARKPYTCSECHKGPDVPAFGVYEVSKHGNIYSSLNKGWSFQTVPWKVGKDFTAPTCATCHVSLLVDGESGDVIAERTHQMSDRIPWRIIGLIYAHAHPKSPDTTIINNKAGLPLPTELTGEPVVQYLIDSKEQEKRKVAMQRICLSCHSQGWVDGQWTRFENTIRTTNEMTLTATQIILMAWERGAAKGLAQGESIFDEAIEKKWVEQWLFFANSTRFASAMAGADYGVFANGRFSLGKNIQEMLDWLEFKLEGKEARKRSD